jgi:hypothetical protein
VTEGQRRGHAAAKRISVRTEGRQATGMTSQTQPRLTRKKRIREYNGRGSIYAWLRAHHGDVTRCRDVEQRPWSILVTEMVSDGVRREDGFEPTVKNVSRVWERVCRDVAAEAAAAKPKRVPPSRISPDWRPTVVPPRPMAPAKPPAAASDVAVPADRDPRIDPTLPPHAQAELAKLFREFDELESKRLKFY